MLGAWGSEKPSEGQKEGDWQSLMVSTDERERIASRKAALEERKETVDALVAIVRSPVEKEEAFYNTFTPRNIAIFLLGKLRAKEAVPELIEFVTPKPGQGTVIDYFSPFSPATEALIQIGLPSVPAFLEKLQAGQTPFKREQCVKALVAIKGLSETEHLIEDRMTDASSTQVKGNLKAVIEVLKGGPLRESLESIESNRHRWWNYY
jgi:hypothetical protein